MPEALPTMEIDPGAVRAPRAPGLPTPRVASLQVDTPHLIELPSPLRDVAASLSKASDETNEVAKLYAKQAGYEAVSRDDQGNLVVAQAPIVGDAAIAFHSAVKFQALTMGESDAKQQDLVLSKQFHDNPDGYLEAAQAFQKAHVAMVSKAAGADVGAALDRSISNDTSANYRSLVLEQQRNIKVQFDQGTLARMGSAEQDMTSLARSGADPNSPAFRARYDDWISANQMRVTNPVLNESPDVAAFRVKNLASKIEANRFLYSIDQTYNDKTVGPDGQPNGGAAAALESAKSILTDQSLKISPQDREAFYHKAVGEIRANEAERRQDLYLTRAAAADLKTASSLGLPIDAEMVDKVASQFYNKGDPGGAARLYAWAGRAPLNDDFGRQPLTAQTAQLTQLRNSYQGSPENAAALKQGAANLGISPRDLAAVISYETAGTFNPSIVGGKGNNYRGLIQFGPEERQKYGVEPGQSFPDQMKSVEGFLRDRGVKPGMGLPEIYKTIIGGNPNVSLNASDQNGTIAQHIGNIQNAHYTSADQFLGTATGPASNPAQSLWLTANRERMITSEAGKGWTFAMKEWNEKGITPNPEMTRSVIEAARATGNHTLLDQVGADLERVNAVSEAAQGPLAGQHAAIAQLRQAASSGDLSVGNAAILKQLEQKSAAIEKGIADNPIATATANFPDKLTTPGPLDPSSSDTLRSGLQQRAGIAAFAAQNWQTKALPAIDKPDVQALQNVLEKSDPATRARIFSDITAAIPDERVRNATFGKLAQKDGKAATMAFAGALYSQAPDTAASIIRGQHAMEVDDRNNPLKEGEGKVAFATTLDKVLPEGAFSLAGRTDPTGPYATMRQATVARYADLTAQDPNSKHDFSEARLKQASDDVTGGILTQNGSRFLAPQRGMSQSDFDRVMYGLKDQDLGGATTLAGEPVTAQYLRSNAQLESYGDGRYLVRLGKDAARPIYAVQGANTEAPRPFVLDLRGRKPGDLPPVGVEGRPYPRG